MKYTKEQLDALQKELDEARKEIETSETSKSENSYYVMTSDELAKFIHEYKQTPVKETSEKSEVKKGLTLDEIMKRQNKSLTSEEARKTLNRKLEGFK